jgi:hypothetical protein
VMTLEATPAYAKYRNQSNFWKNSMLYPRGAAVILWQFGVVTAPDRCRRCNLPHFDLLATMYRTARKEAVGTCDHRKTAHKAQRLTAFSTSREKSEHKVK